jgi:hypothetical protein
MWRCAWRVRGERMNERDTETERYRKKKSPGERMKTRRNLGKGIGDDDAVWMRANDRVAMALRVVHIVK